MIIQSPESDMPEPYKTYVRHRNGTIADVLSDVVHDEDVQLCPRAILEEEKVIESSDLVYGAVVANLEDGYKTVLYRDEFRHLGQVGLATGSVHEASEFAIREFDSGNRIRVKDPKESDGNGQHTVETTDELAQAFNEVRNDETEDVVVMPHLKDISHRLSVGHINLGKFGSFSYVGHEQIIQHEGSDVYGGTDIGLFGGSKTENFDKICDALEIPRSLAELGIRAIRRYSRIVRHLGRVSVDVIEGTTDSGQKVSSVADITPRVGGVTPAEVLAVREIDRANDPDMICLASSQLLYNPDDRPSVGHNFVDTDSLVINARVTDLRK